jgi:hypothetical protein
MALNHAFDRRSIDLLLAIDKIGWLQVSGDGVLECAALVAADYIRVAIQQVIGSPSQYVYRLLFTERGRQFVDGWKRGDQNAISDVAVVGSSWQI